MRPAHRILFLSARGAVEFYGNYILDSQSKKLKAGRGTVGKAPVLAMRERGGRTVAVPVENTDKGTIQDAIIQRVQRHTLERLESFVGGTKGKRLTYKGLIQ